MKRLSILTLLIGLAIRPAIAGPSGEEGIALAIVYDTSGSMKSTVPAGNGTKQAKYLIANQALNGIVNRINQFATSAAAGSPRKIEAGLFIFKGTGAEAVVPYGPFDPQPFQKWAGHFDHPSGTTPLGNAIKTASEAVMGSKLNHKHVVVITDGANTSGPKPEEVIPGLKTAAMRNDGAIAFHFVAFDVSSSVFEPARREGATVLAAANKQELNSQLEFIFEHKILLEDEEPKSPAAPTTK